MQSLRRGLVQQAPHNGARLGIRVGIEGRIIRHRQNLAGARIHDDRASAGRLVLDNAGVELLFGDVLQILIGGQFERRTGRRRMFEPAEHVAASIGLVLCVPITTAIAVYFARRGVA